MQRRSQQEHLQAPAQSTVGGDARRAQIVLQLAPSACSNSTSVWFRRINQPGNLGRELHLKNRLCPKCTLHQVC